MSLWKIEMYRDVRILIYVIYKNTQRIKSKVPVIMFGK